MLSETRQRTRKSNRKRALLSRYSLKDEPKGEGESTRDNEHTHTGLLGRITKRQRLPKAQHPRSGDRAALVRP